MERLPRLTGHCLAPDGLNSRAPIPACPPYHGETSTTVRSVGSRHVTPSPPRTSGDRPHTVASAVPCDHETADATPVQERTPQLTRTDPSRTAPLDWNEAVGGRLNRRPSRNKTIRPRDRTPCRTLQPRQLNRETLSDRLAPLTVPQRTAHYPEQTIERSDHDGRPAPKKTTLG